MIDTYIWGNVDRISPEAPVPIVSITKKESRLGGAANVALNVQALGATPLICSVIGDDLEGIEFIGKVDWDKDQNGQDKCVIKSAITAEHKDYAAYVNGSAPSVSPAPGTSTVNAYAQATGRSPVPGRPSWAQ